MPNPYAPPLASVRDIAIPHAMAEPADRGTRLAAALLDTIVFAVMVYAPLLLATLFAPMALDNSVEAPLDDGRASTMLAVSGGLTLVGFGVWLWLTLKYMKQNGQSIGKKILDIKVVRTDGTPVALGRYVWLRNVVNTLVSIIPLYGIVDVLFIFSESRQCLHDKIADTVVVKD